jgi:hypothetical protein
MRPYLKKKKKQKWAEDLAQVEYLPHKGETLSSNPSTAKTTTKIKLRPKDTIERIKQQATNCEKLYHT